MTYAKTIPSWFLRIFAASMRVISAMTGNPTLDGIFLEFLIEMEQNVDVYCTFTKLWQS